jgi:hypothetical protein
MTAGQFELLADNEAEAVLLWRFENLTRTGAPVGDALVIASHVEIDLHEAAELLRKGCPPELVVPILA